MTVMQVPGMGQSPQVSPRADARPTPGQLPGVNQTMTPRGEALDKLHRLYGENLMLIAKEFSSKGVNFDPAVMARARDGLNQVLEAFKGFQATVGQGPPAQMPQRARPPQVRPLDSSVDAITRAPMGPVSGQGDQSFGNPRNFTQG